MPQTADRVQETTTTSGTGAWTLAGAVTGYRSFSSAFNAGAIVWYAAYDGSSNWEVGLGQFNGTTLSRLTVYASSNGGSLVSFSGTVNLWADAPADVVMSAGQGRRLATQRNLSVFL